jgi:hypothetical protein
LTKCDPPGTKVRSYAGRRNRHAGISLQLELSTVDADTGWQGKAHPYRSGSRVEWATAAGINGGPIFRRVSRLDKIWGDGITPKAIWRVRHLAGGELEQIQFLLGPASVQTTEPYLCKQRLNQAVNDHLGLEET